MPQLPLPSLDTHVRFGNELSVLYWTGVFNCTELKLREAAAVLKSTAVQQLRAYFSGTDNNHPAASQL